MASPNETMRIWLSAKENESNLIRTSKYNVSLRRRTDVEHVGLGAVRYLADSWRDDDMTTDEVETLARDKEETRPLVLFFITGYAACKVFLLKLVTLDSIFTCLLSVGLTLYIYFDVKNGRDPSWTGSMDWVLLGFAVVTPISVSVSLAFRRRDRALFEIATFRCSAFQIYLIHTMWDWDIPPKGRSASDVNWLDHGDEVLSNLVGMADELCRFLTLPTSSRARHRVTRSGRKEASLTVEAAYRLLDSCLTRRFVALTRTGERLKYAGFPAGESSRMRQYERFMAGSIENLRMIKMYRTPQAMRAFARLFTVLLPVLYTPYFARLAFEVDSLALGVSFAVITSLALTALCESVENLEDPFVGHLTLDGISKYNCFADAVRWVASCFSGRLTANRIIHIFIS